MPPPVGRRLEAPRQRRRGEPPQGLLRMATHNVNGLGAHLEACVQQWVDLRLDVVVVVETHASMFTQFRLERQVNTAARQRAAQSFGGTHPGYSCYLGTRNR